MRGQSCLMSELRTRHLMSEHQTRYLMFESRTRRLTSERWTRRLTSERRTRRLTLEHWTRRVTSEHRITRCQHPPKADHQLWVVKTTLSGMKGWRDANKRMINRCSLCSTKRSDSNKRMKSCRHKC
ncbi:hypothetical protein CK203_045735 [Vitis vinifera]|uniref:Uncharacterized protein n=1 Tax=Vitis vinifera TaxID=29760 RepID=A0A438I117_VITVI|nr:hypothetical protein CK203_045735 [Vitis vinifera]